MFKFITIWFTSFAFLFSGITPVSASPPPMEYDYVALGDSIAAGVRAVYGQMPGWEASSNVGYTDLVARYLKANHVLGDFNEDYAFSGWTSTQLLGALNSLTFAEKSALFGNKEIVTVTIGANDFLQPLYVYYATTDTPTVEGVMAVLASLQEPTYLTTTGGTLANNLAAILGIIHAFGPSAQVYVMGYYNPLPTAPTELGVASLVTFINNFIYNTVIAANVSAQGLYFNYVPTLSAMNDGYSSYAYDVNNLLEANRFGLPDIHPTVKGYKTIAGEFIEAIDDDFGF